MMLMKSRILALGTTLMAAAVMIFAADGHRSLPKRTKK
jgi:hypothetical protein